MRAWIASLLLLAGCAAPPVATATGTVQATRVGLLSAGDTGVLVGRVVVPAGFEPPSGNVEIAAIGPAGGFKASVPLSADRTFRVTDVPVDTPVRLMVTARWAGSDAPLRAIAKLASRLGCTTMDLASTAIAAKATSTTPWVVAPGGHWADVTETMDPTRVAEVEEAVRDALAHGAGGTSHDKGTAVVDDHAETVFDDVVNTEPGIGGNWDSALQGVEASLMLSVKAVGKPSTGGWRLLAVGENAASIPGKGFPRVFGQLELVMAPEAQPGSRAVFFLNEHPVGEASAANGWKSHLDTWRYPDGGYTLSTVGVAADGTRNVLDRSYLDIANDPRSYCATP